ncbi:hypothetical protein Mtc_1137 [Methanocella conradii HZ254]|uniref:Uncharacterized protein n=1 Tax=Methanocella conradii (strain DSM 24694 / JCM 17849 / CGMCC 1.5162 / HZ254) TaxID=1041930 RepID=H8I7Q8_METCZ|nr:hypothetical protein [Methanocella conradii]AFC99893.1 hypothetical protein Mtc_1137 [Methanocella conradii HZ254]
MKNPLKVLALSGLMLAVIASGTAFAWTWNQVDWSQLTSSSKATWYDNSEGTPHIAGGSEITWQNTFDNEFPSSSYYPTLDAIRDDGGDRYRLERATRLDYRYAWCPDGTELDDRLTAETTSGSHSVNVDHFYGLNRGGSDVRVSVTHYYTV